MDWPGLPAPPESVLASLRSVHAGLFVVRTQYKLDQATGRPIEDAKTGEPIESARYWVWIDHRGKKSPLFPVETPEGEYMPCDMRLVHRIGTDVGIVSPTVEAMWAAIQAKEDSAEEQRQESERERFRRFIENNGPAWREAIASARDGETAARRRFRDPVIYGYDGQPVRSSSHGTIAVTGQERGIDTGE